jgi:hypothetical protein
MAISLRATWVIAGSARDRPRRAPVGKNLEKLLRQSRGYKRPVCTQKLHPGGPADGLSPSRPIGENRCFSAGRPASLRLILRRMWQRPFVREHLAEIAAIDPAAARRAPGVMLGLVLGWLADWPPEIGASWDHRRGGSLWMNSGHSLSLTTRISSEMIAMVSISTSCSRRRSIRPRRGGGLRPDPARRACCRVWSHTLW